MARTSLKVVVAVAALLVGSVASAASADSDRRVVRAQLEGFQEVPAVSTDASGSIRLRVSRDGETIFYRLAYRDLSSAVQQAHIHFGQEDVNGGVAAFLCSNLTPVPEGVPACPQQGSVAGTITADDVVGPEAQGIAPGELDELLTALRAGVTYANVHTEMHPMGEIRGQLAGHGHD